MSTLNLSDMISKFRTVAIFVIDVLQTILNTQIVGMFIMYLRTMAAYNGWLVFGVRLKGKNIFCTAAMLFYILQKLPQKKRLHIFRRTITISNFSGPSIPSIH
jgi:hypothetical protein